MTSADTASLGKALLSVWVRPRTTISQIIAVTKTPHILVLAALGATMGLVEQMLDAKDISGLFDLRILAAILISGAILGAIGNYVSGFICRLAGLPLGGRASYREMRALLAWGMVPAAAGLVLALIAISVVGIFHTGVPYWGFMALRTTLIGLDLWSMVITVLMLARIQGFGWRRVAGNCLLVGVMYAVLMLVPLGFRMFGFEPFTIPSASMAPTLVVGDYIFVSKSAYGYSRYSVPFDLLSFEGRIGSGEPERGDVVVFRCPPDNRSTYIKRVVGLPGDRIQVTHRVLSINGTPVERVAAEDYGSAHQVTERLPNGRDYKILESIGDETGVDNTPEYVVPPDHYFVLGDNRDNSQDSRFLLSVGYIPKDNLIGKVGFVWYSSDAVAGVRFDRLGLGVH